MQKESRLGRIVADWLQPYLPQQPTEDKQAQSIEKKEMPYQVTGHGYQIEQYLSPSTIGLVQSYEGWVYACVNKISQTCAQTELDLYQQKSDGAEQLTRHNAIDLIEKANEFMTLYDLIELTFIYLGLTGEAYWWKERGQGKQVTGLYPWFNPSYMRVIPGSDRFIGGFIYRVPETGEEIAFDADDIVYFRFPDPLRRFRGTSPVKAAALDIDTEKKAKKYNWNFFNNNAKPGGILQTEGKLTQETFDRIKVQFENNHKGEGNAYRTALLEQGLEFKEIGLSHVDMDFINQRTFSRDAILAIFGVPKSVLGIVEDVNRASAEASRYTFLKETITPLLRKFVGTLNEQLIVPDFGEDLFFDFPNLTPEDDSKKLARYDSALNHGWMSLNEVRAQESLEPVEGADSLYIPFNVVSVASTDAAKAVKVTPQNMQKKYRTKEQLVNDLMDEGYAKRSKKLEKLLKKKKGKSSMDSKGVKCRMSNESFDECLTRKIPEIMQEDPDLDEHQAVAIASSYCKIPCGEKKNEELISKFSQEQKAAVWKAFDLGVRREVPKYQKMVRNVYGKMEKAVLSKLRYKKDLETKAPRRKLVEKYLIDQDAFVEVFMNQFLNSEIISIGVTAKNTANLFGLQGSIPDEMGKLFAMNSIKKFAKSTTNTINEKLAASLIEGLEAGESVFKLRNRVKGVFTSYDNVGAERIARTELTRITTYANEELYRQSGIAFKEWLVNPGACFVAGSQILKYNEGEIQSVGIDKLEIGDYVIGDSGKPRKVLAIRSKPYKGNIVFGNGFAATPDHKFLCNDGQWRPIGQYALQANFRSLFNFFISKTQNIPTTFKKIVSLSFIFPSNFRFAMPVNSITEYNQFPFINNKINNPSLIHRDLFSKLNLIGNENTGHDYFNISFFDFSSDIKNKAAMLSAKIIPIFNNPTRVFGKSFFTLSTYNFYSWFPVRIFSSFQRLPSLRTQERTKFLSPFFFSKFSLKRFFAPFAAFSGKERYFRVDTFGDIIAFSGTVFRSTFNATMKYFLGLTAYLAVDILRFHKPIVTRLVELANIYEGLVYDIQVENDNSFTLSCGLIAHNCEFCLPLSGKIVPIGKPFFDKGDTVFGQGGEELDLDYETVSRPPLHPSCRCDLLPYAIGPTIDYSRVPLPSPETIH